MIAIGVPATVSLPLAAELVTQHTCGTVVGWDDPQAAAQAVLELRDDEARRVEFGRRSHRAPLADHDWRAAGAKFIAQLESWASMPTEPARRRSRRPLR